MKLDIETDQNIDLLLEKRGLRKEDLLDVITNAEKTGQIFIHSKTGHSLSYQRPGNTTYWVEFTREQDSFKVYSAYSHRMLPLEGFNMPAKEQKISDWFCLQCNVTLELATVKLTYLEETFGAETFACPKCGRIFISEHDAVNKMALAEKMLEDK